MFDFYGAHFSVASLLYKNWNISVISNKKEIDDLLISPILKELLLPNGKICLVRRYSLAELEALGANLKCLDSDKHEFFDTKFGYNWQQVYHGMAENWLDLFEVNEPVLQQMVLDFRYN